MISLTLSQPKKRKTGSVEIPLPACRVPFAKARWRREDYSIFAVVAKAVAVVKFYMIVKF